MATIKIDQLGPVNECKLEIDDFMVLTGPQSSGKSTIAKCIYYFKNVRNVILQLLRKQYMFSEDQMELSLKNRLIREMRSIFLQIFGSTWCMSNNMCIQYEYADGVEIGISLRNDSISPNYIWVEMSEGLISFLNHLEAISGNGDLLSDMDFQNAIKQRMNDYFCDDSEVVYIPAGRSMITLLSSQLSYIYSTMDDTQRRSIDYCTQNYLERILQLKSFFADSLDQLVKNQKELTAKKMNMEIIRQAMHLIKHILKGEYRNVSGEERLQVTQDRYVKINFASSGQQEAVWILNVLFYYLLQGRKTYFIVEEPESHLYPDAQKLITEFIALVKNAGNQVMLTTHSPYILGTLNNLLYASKISGQVNNEDLSKIIYAGEWIAFDSLSSYYVNEGRCDPCMDKEFQCIENGMIDGASEIINEDFEQMIALRETVG